ncbi:MAG: hypothetical protein HQ504_12720 [Rhodospirillaceae bacterium]|nr:hypothetical protein [Rhodospirillaceae bacterium]
MKTLSMIAALIVLLAASPAAAAEFLTAIEDLPLMPGLSEDVDTAMTFNSQTGRIVETFAAGPVERAAVLKFYADTLPQLGWMQIGNGVFVREGEVLTLEFPDAEGHLSVRFSLSPGS